MNELVNWIPLWIISGSAPTLVFNHSQTKVNSIRLVFDACAVLPSYLTIASDRNQPRPSHWIYINCWVLHVFGVWLNSWKNMFRHIHSLYCCTNTHIYWHKHSYNIKLAKVYGTLYNNVNIIIFSCIFEQFVSVCEMKDYSKGYPV
jgi:hypothetical protein